MRTITINETIGGAYHGEITVETDDAELIATLRALLTAPEAQQGPVDLGAMPARAAAHEAAMADVSAANAYADYAAAKIAQTPQAAPAAPERTYTLQDARVRAGWKTQVGAAYHLGISASYVSRLEAAPIHDIPEQMLRRLCSAYDITPAELRDPPAIASAAAVAAKKAAESDGEAEAS